ncbi:hypothetical protein PR202_ga24778 [Eleusine coracana subsp. coracana]|uniref:DUF868 family protein n=1 Tax=Eleusine coracana subsp. coracana TaxID=191504 RepID=A0AAV5D962_ELECO|nr:hypothetical protein PR202_ga24778 [Eleusine coracana subsp. coracana]
MVSASSLLLPSSVRDLASCVSDGAVRVACTTTPASTRITSFSSSSSSSSSTSSSSSPSNLSVAITYRATRLSPSAPPLLLRLIWRKGTRSVAGDPPLALFWDLTAAKYGAASPEPVSGFYVVAVAVADAEVVLAVGDLAAEFVKAKFEGQIPKARFLPVARADRVVAPTPPGHNHHHHRSTSNAMHTARVRFAEDGAEHEVSVGCSSSTRPGDEELWVSVDGKRAVTARSLRWNFRGNQTVFVDGAPVDVMWDLHGWWFRDPPGCAVVMLRARSALESRLWLEEEVAAPGFSLVVQAFKSPT